MADPAQATTDDVRMSPYRWFTYKLTQAAMDQRARNQPPPVVEGYDIELVKGRRSQGHRTSVLPRHFPWHAAQAHGCARGLGGVPVQWTRRPGSC